MTGESEEVLPQRARPHAGRTHAARCVLMTVDALGGVWTYALDLARALARHEVRIALAVLGPSPSAAQRADAACLPNVTLYEHGGRVEWMDDPWAGVEAAAAWLRELDETLLPDVVHLNGYCHGSLSWSAPVLIAGHSCVLSWWQAVRRQPAPARYGRYALEATRGLRAAHAIVAPSATMVNALHTHYGPFPRARVIPNGRFETEVVPACKEPFVLTAGRVWDDAKNVDAVCRVASRLAWPVHVAGDTMGSSVNGSAAGAATRVPNVTFLGRLTGRGMANAMASASIFALPVRYEPFGLSALEAAQAACALVLGDIPSQREIWEDAAMYVAPDDTRLLTATLKRLIDNEGLRAVMGARARARSQVFSAERMGDRYYDLYSELMRDVRPVLALRAV